MSYYHFLPLGIKRPFFLIICNPSIDPKLLGPTAAGTAPNHTVDGRSLTARLGQNTLSSLQFCQVRLQARDDSVPVWD